MTGNVAFAPSALSVTLSWVIFSAIALCFYNILLYVLAMICFIFLQWVISGFDSDATLAVWG